MKKEIQVNQVDENTIRVEITLERRKFLHEPKFYFRVSEIIPSLEESHGPIKLLSGPTSLNNFREGEQVGSWIFNKETPPSTKKISTPKPKQTRRKRTHTKK